MYRVTLADQSTYDAQVVGFDQDKDVAVLRIEAPKDKLRPIPIGVSADLLVGQKVYAIGNPVSNLLYYICQCLRWLHGCFVSFNFLLIVRLHILNVLFFNACMDFFPRFFDYQLCFI